MKQVSEETLEMPVESTKREETTARELKPTHLKQVVEVPLPSLYSCDSQTFVSPMTDNLPSPFFATK